MKALILAKSNSTRVRNKNFRPFHGSLSLTDLTVRKLLDELWPDDIYLSTDSQEQAQAFTDRYGINAVLRDLLLTENKTPITQVIRKTVSQVPGDGDVAVCMVCDPFFDGHSELFMRWPLAREEGFDSLAVLQPQQEHLLDEEFRPLGFDFGPGHLPSQLLPRRYRMNFALSILTRAAVQDTGYHVGRRPYWYINPGPSLDIDTQWDFDLAQAGFASYKR